MPGKEISMLNIAEVLKRGVSIDSRTIKRGQFFIAIRGKRFDGHDFIDTALKKGAFGVIGEEKGAMIRVKDSLTALGNIAAYHRKRFNIPIVGITGSNGKTTTKDMIAHILSYKGTVLKNNGTENNLIGLPLTLLRLKSRHSFAVLEMGANSFGEIRRLSNILKPNIGLITNIGPSHLEYFKDIEGVLKAKSELLEVLGIKETLFLNGDDAMLTRLKPRSIVKTFGKGRKNDIQPSHLKVKFLGEHNEFNALSAIGVCMHLGISMNIIQEALGSFKGSSMRMEHKRIKGIDIINDAYNSNPLSLKCAIDAFSKFKAKGKRIVVSGDMLELGKKDRLFHGRAGRHIASSSIDKLVAVGSLSRYTLQAASRAGMDKDCLWSCLDSREAAALLKKIIEPGDAVLIKGSRSMSMEKIIDEL